VYYMGHDKHQYYFEKYLRDELSELDKSSFVEKLSEDANLRNAFNDYKKNRAAQLKRVLAGNEETTLNNKLLSAMYLLISVTGIALAVNYYIDNEKLKLSNESLEKHNKPKERKLWDKLPVFGNKSNKATPAEIITEPEEIELEDALLSDNRKAATIALNMTDKKTAPNNNLKADILLHDTFLAPIEKEVYELRFKVVKSRADSMNNDSITNLTYSRISQGKLHTDNPVLVEFWKSPVNYKGYSFNGKKLVLYGLSKPYAISLYIEKKEISLKFKDGLSVKLIKDNEFHKF
jgi:hypothetical protein